MNHVQGTIAPIDLHRLRGFPPLQNTGFALINYLHEEAMGCLDAGFHQAAIMATSVLFEATIKLLVTASEISRGTGALRSVKKWNNVSLEKLIDELLERGLIPAERAHMFHEKRREMRNFYQHGNTPLIDFKKEELDEFDEMGVVVGLYFAHSMSLMVNTQQVSFEWFLFVDREVRNRIPWNDVARSIAGSVGMQGSIGGVKRKDIEYVFGSNPKGAMGKTRDIWGSATGATSEWN